MPIHERTSQRLLLAAVGCHLILAIVAAFWPQWAPAGDSVDDIPAGLLSVCQTSLLGLWLVFGRSGWQAKLLGTVVVCSVGIASPWIAESQTWPSLPLSDVEWFIAGVALAPLPLTAAAAWLARRGWGDVLRCKATADYSSPGLQFSLRQLWLWSLPFALLLFCCRLASLALTQQTTPRSMFVFALVMGLLTTCNAIAALWASLSSDRVGLRLLIAAALAASAGLLAGFVVGGMERWPIWLIAAVISMAQGLVLNVTLLLLRIAGYRLSRTEQLAEESKEPVEPNPQRLATLG